MKLPPALEAAYRRTNYEANGAVARIGRRSAALDALLRARRVRQAAFITAWNPFSHPMPRGWNEKAQARLRQVARTRLLAEGWGREDRRGDDRWGERHLLLEGDPRRLAVLARRFRQNAIVAVAPGRKARLVVTQDVAG